MDARGGGGMAQVFKLQFHVNQLNRGEIEFRPNVPIAYPYQESGYP